MKTKRKSNAASGGAKSKNPPSTTSKILKKSDVNPEKSGAHVPDERVVNYLNKVIALADLEVLNLLLLDAPLAKPPGSAKMMEAFDAMRCFHDMQKNDYHDIYPDLDGSREGPLGAEAAII